MFLLFISLIACEDPDAQSDITELQVTIESLQAEVRDLKDQAESCDTKLTSLQDELTALQSDVDNQAQDIDDLRSDVDLNINDLVAQGEDIDNHESRLGTVEASVTALEPVAPLLDYLSVDTTSHSVIFTGANVYVQSGSGDTYGAVNGLGNLIVGYDEDDGSDDKSGSHNLIVGQEHSYSGFAGVVFGADNTIDNVSSVLGGSQNQTSYSGSVVVGGTQNEASGSSSVVIAGERNEASGRYSVVVAGYDNEATGNDAAILGGTYNVAGGGSSTVYGGLEQNAGTSNSYAP